MLIFKRTSAVLTLKWSDLSYDMKNCYIEVDYSVSIVIYREKRAFVYKED